MDVEVNFHLVDCSDKIIEFTSYNSVVNFFENEIGFWEEKKGIVPSGKAANSKYINYSSKLRSALGSMMSWDDIYDLPSSDVNQRLNALKNATLKDAAVSWIWSGHGYANKYVECLQHYGPTRANSFVEFIVNKSFSTINNAEILKGYLFGYEFLYQDSDIPSRREAEEKSLNLLRDEFFEQKEQMFLEKEKIKNEIHESDQFFTDKFTRSYHAQRRLFNIKSNKRNADFNKEMDQWREKIAILENTYQEKLKLKKPAEYWSSASKRYGIESLFGIVAFISINIFALMYFKEFFFAWLKDEPVALGLSSLQGAVIFGSLAAIYAYMIRMLAKLTFSSLHLMRDTKEREHLTYLYLSLSHEAEVDDKSREIVLQALFSRSDSGLLGQDSGVTMPGVGGFLDHLNKR